MPYPEFFMHPSKSEIFGRFSSRNSGYENELISIEKIYLKNGQNKSPGIHASA